jgi:hypothetical protein
MARTAKLVEKANFIEARGETDTIKLWENYRDQALLWRSLLLLQIPVPALALIMALILYVNRMTVLNVPAKPLPGQYDANEIPDEEFVDAGTAFVNLFATYQPYTVKRQFNRLREMLVEPYLNEFNLEIMDKELKTIETTSRTQLFFVDPTRTTVERNGSSVTVSFSGDRQKFVAGKEVEPVQTRYRITMTTVPRNDLNPYGIVVNNVYAEKLTN